jgi:hypothetical protein
MFLISQKNYLIITITMVKKLSTIEKAYILSQIDLKIPYRKIIQNFNFRFKRNVSLKTIWQSQFPPKDRKGRPRKTSTAQDKIITRTIHSNAFKPWKVILQILREKYQINICKLTLIKRAKEEGIRTYKSAPKIKINSYVALQRLNFANQYKMKRKAWWRK